MKRNILFITILFFLFGNKISAQTIVFHEDFEVVDSMVSSGTPAWFQDSNYHTDGTHCIRDTVPLNGTSYLTSNAFSTVGNFFVLFSFDQICKISFADQGYVEVSNDNGNTWITLNGTHYLGSSTYFPTFHYFGSFSYGSPGWDAAHDLTVPLSSWWRTELFDLSSVAANSAQVKIRFRITDGNGNGNSGNYGWLIDHVMVQAAPHELVPPVIRWAPPVLQGTIYSLGPFTISDTITDASVITSATLYYSVNGSTPVPVTMTNTGNIYQGIIPPVSLGDTVCYYVVASDTWGNTSTLPAFGCQSFVTSLGISLPYFDNFDVNNIWRDSTISGSHWQLGTPAFGQTTGAHSSPNAWDVELNSAYLPNTVTYLVSPILNFIGVYGAELSFWRNNNCEVNWDGVRVEYTTNGTSWKLLGRFGDPRGTNWYNYANINSNPGPAFSGSSGGWVQSKYMLDTLNNTAGPVQLRFVFTSDPSGQLDGFSIDDLSISLPPPHDVGVTSILRPGNIAAASTTDSISIFIRNFGTDTTGYFPVAYRINGGSPVVEIYPGVVQPGSNATYTFSTPYMVPQGTFAICAWTGAINDGNPLNDSICKNSYGIARMTIPYADNFDTGAVLWRDSSILGTNWQLGTPAFGQTTGAFSGPSCWDINLTTAYQNNARSYLTSPLFDFTGIINARLSFWQNRNTDNNNDGTRLEYSINAGSTWTILGTYHDPNATNWYTKSNLTSTSLPGWDSISVNSGGTPGWVKSTYSHLPAAIAGPNVMFRFVFASNPNIPGQGISMDDFVITLPSPDDVGTTGIIQPGNFSSATLTDSVRIVVYNYGASPATNFDVAYRINTGSIVSQTYSGTLQPGAYDTILFNTPFLSPIGNYNICAWTSLTGDGDHFNDTICKTSFGISRMTIPYADNFDTGAVLWFDSSAPGTNWQVGTPAFGQTTGAFSGATCWDINLTTGYLNNARSYLTSPLFDFTGVANARLSFWQNRNTENTWDGTRLEYSINAGSTWTILGTYQDPNATNWYNKMLINSSGLPAWDSISLSPGGTPGWQKSTYAPLPVAISGPNVMFRFVFTSDGAVVGQGISIDDFVITLPSPQDVGATMIIRPGNSSSATTDDSVRIVIYNYGASPATNFDVAYRVNTGSIVSQTYTGILQPGTYDTILFNTPFLPPVGNYNICAWTSLTGDGDHFNDTICKTSFGEPVYTLMYADNFDTSAVVWHDSSNGVGTNWTLGTPAFGQTTGAYSAPSCWDLNLTSTYTDNAVSYLISPLFDLTSIATARLSFWQNRNVEYNYDGMRMEYSTNGGSTWTILGIQNDPNAIHWYNKATIQSSQLPAWDSISIGPSGTPGWQECTYLNLPAACYGHLVMFRYVFTSDPSITRDGISIDNFQLWVPVVGISSADQPSGILKVYPNPSSGIFYLKKEDWMKNNSSIFITDMLGNEIWKGSLNKSNFTTIDLSAHPNGIYLLSVSSDEKFVNQRIVLCK